MIRLKPSSFSSEVESKRVAVVGNSLSLFDSKWGVNIDDHDVVIRFNKPAVLLSNDVSDTHGTKFDFWAFWSVGSFHRSVLKDENCIEDIKTAFYKNTKIRKMQTAINGHISLTRDHIDYTLDRTMYLKLGNILKHMSNNSKITPSVGISILHWLMYSGVKEVSIYGFDFKKTPTFSELEKYKTDMNGQFDTRCKHDFKSEEDYVNGVILKDKRFELYK
jgi:hypothetical protein